VPAPPLDDESIALSAEEHAANVAKPADSGACKVSKSGASEEAATTLQPRRCIAPEDGLQVEPLAVELQLTHVGQECSLDDRQGFQGDGAAGILQERLHEIEIEQREIRVLAWAGKLPDDRVHDSDRKFAGSCQIASGPQVGRRAPPRYLAICVEWPATEVVGRVAAVELHVESETLSAHVQSRQVEGLQLIPPIDGIKVGESHRGFRVQRDGTRLRQFDNLTEP
jgi:hypothetical protein